MALGHHTGREKRAVLSRAPLLWTLSGGSESWVRGTQESPAAVTLERPPFPAPCGHSHATRPHPSRPPLGPAGHRGRGRAPHAAAASSPQAPRAGVAPTGGGRSPSASRCPRPPPFLSSVPLPELAAQNTKPQQWTPGREGPPHAPQPPPPPSALLVASARWATRAELGTHKSRWAGGH